jgi:hypothetical protein
MSQDLPTVDLTGFNIYSPPNKHFICLNPESQEEDDRLKALLGVDILISALGKKLNRPKKGELVIKGELCMVAQTFSGQLVAVALQLAFGSTKVQDGRWVAFVVDPEHYPELQADTEAKITEYRNYIENMFRGMEQKN